MYSYFIKSPARGDRTFKRLSLTTKTPISYNELLEYAFNYANNNQLGVNQVIIQCIDNKADIISKYNPYNFDENIKYEL